jgi:hypothetical protein
VEVKCREDGRVGRWKGGDGGGALVQPPEVPHHHLSARLASYLATPSRA